MNTRLNQWDKAVWFYDLLAGLVFFGRIKKSQKYFLNLIPNGSRILIIGGGTGWLLKEVVEGRPSCMVWYVEASSSMLGQSKKQIKGLTENVKFIHGTQHDLPHGTEFDVIITNFVLDLFPESDLGEMTNQMKQTLRSSGLWLVTDFVNTGRLWQQLLLDVMYRFFKWVLQIQTKNLPPWERVVKSHGFKMKFQQSFFCSFIKSIVWEK